MRGPSLVVWGGGPVRGLRARALEGAEVVSWLGGEAETLAAAGVPFRSLEQVIGPEALAAADAAGRNWARVWARLPLVEGRSFRDLVEWRGESLLWTAEGFLRTATAGPRCARTAELCLKLLDTLRPLELDACGLAAADAALLARAATASGVLFHGSPGAAKPLASVPSPARPGTLRRLFQGFLPRRPVLPDGGLDPRGTPLVLFVVAREQDRGGLAPLVQAARDEPWLRTAVVAAEALPQSGTRKTRRAVTEGERRLSARLSTLRGTPAVAASHVHRGVGFADLAASDLDAVLLGRLPAALRTLEHALAVFEAVHPALVVLAVADRDERRTLGMAAAAAGAPWAALRVETGPDDEPDRADGGPHPVASLTLGEDAALVLARLREVARDRVGAP
jgi:hypothetical protein